MPTEHKFSHEGVEYTLPRPTDDWLQPIPEWMFGKSVDARNALQNCGKVHPFTCRDNDCRQKTNQAPLRAIDGGWICDHCGYNQLSTDM